ncbi:MAG TPA: folate-binding protein [Burkholderiaceae bacterium]|nr:folate-binding protein [Burkholderiaceae bacterium]
MNSHAPLEASLDDLALLEVSGPDAATFLQGQLTQDIASSNPARAQLAGYCSPKGRLMASMIVWQGADPPSAFFILLKQDIAAAFAARLAKFVLRAKVSIKPLPARIDGVLLPMTEGALESLAMSDAGSAQLVTYDDDQASELPTPPSGVFRPYDITRSNSGIWVAAPSGHPALQRWWRIIPDASASASSIGANRSSQPLHSALSVPASCWQTQDIAAGLGWVVSATHELFIPQTLNLDLIGGLSFTKGCYPGQEVVARSHYRGTIKRRMAHGLIPAANQQAEELPGSDIYDSTHPDAPCGRVINAVNVSGAGHILFEAALTDLGQADFRLGAADGPAITLESLPYDITATA